MKLSNILKGAASLGSVFSGKTLPEIRVPQSDRGSAESDWEKVGEDILKAISSVKKKVDE